MKTVIFLIAFSFLLFFESKGQIFSDNKQGEELYLNGTKLIEIGNYKGADSVLTLALCTYKNEDVYYNRGISRLYKADTSGFCEGMNIAANKYFDVTARQLYNKICCYKVDSIFYDKKLANSNRSDYRYLEEIQFIKKSNERNGVIHERYKKEEVLSLDLSCEQKIIGLGTKTTDIIAGYRIIDSTKFYYKSTEGPSVDNVYAYKELKDKFSKYFSTKYKELKNQFSNETVTVSYEIKISNTGKIISGKYLDILPEISIVGYEKELEKDAQDILKRYPKINPAKFNREKVFCIVHDEIVF